MKGAGDRRRKSKREENRMFEANRTPSEIEENGGEKAAERSAQEELEGVGIDRITFGLIKFKRC